MPFTVTGGKYASATLVTTTLNGAISASDTSIVLTSATGFPTSGTVSIDSEEIAYTGISTNTLTGCTRGQNFTTATTHASGAAARRGRRVDIFVTTTPFVSTDFTDNKPRRVEVYNSAGTVFRGTAFVRRFVSTSQLELESSLYDPYNRTFVEAQSGDTILVSKNFVDIAQAGLTVSGGVATFTDTITFGTNGSASGVCFHDENYVLQFNITTAFALMLGVAGGGVSFGHVQNWQQGTIYGSCKFNYGSASVYRSSNYATSTSARLYIFGGQLINHAAGFLVYHGIAVNTGFVLSGTLFGHLWYLKSEFYIDHSVRDQTVNPLAHVYEDCSFFSTGSLAIPVYVGQSSVIGGLFKFPNNTSGPQSFFGFDVVSGFSTLDIGGRSGNRSVILDMGSSNTLIGGSRPASETFTVNITNMISTDYRAGARISNQPENNSATWITKNLYWKDPFTNLKDGTVSGMIRNSAWDVDSTATASGDGSSVDLTANYGTATGHTVFTTRGPWTARVRKYAFDELEYAVNETPYSLGTAGTVFNVTFGGFQNQIARTTLPSQATADAVTGVTVADHGASPVSWNSKTWSITITGDTSVNAGLTAPLIWAYVKSQITKLTTWSGKSGILWHVLVDENPSGSGYISQRGTSGGAGATLKGVRVIDQSGNPFPGFSYMTADDGTTYTPPVIANITLSAPALLDNTRVRLWNSTQSTEIANTTVSGGAGYSINLTSGVEYNQNDILRLIATYSQSGVAKRPYAASAQATTTNIVFSDPQVDWTEYNTLGIDGSTVTECATDYVNIEVDVTDPTDATDKARIAAFIVHSLTTANGIRNWVTVLGVPVIRFENVANATVDTTVSALTVKNEKAASKLRIEDAFALKWSDGVQRIDAVLGSSIIWSNPSEVFVEGIPDLAMEVWDYPLENTVTSGEMVRGITRTQLGKVDVNETTGEVTIYKLDGTTVFAQSDTSATGDRDAPTISWP